MPDLRVSFLSPLGDGAMLASATGWISLIWFVIVQLVCALGYFQMYVLKPCLVAPPFPWRATSVNHGCG